MARIKLKIGENEIEVYSRDFYVDNQTLGEIIDNISQYMPENQAKIVYESNSKQISNKMNQFHNHIIKSNLYKVSVDTKNKSLLELACGQGSDLNRWITNNFTKVLGIDYTLDNITNARAGAYSRLLNLKYYNKHYSRILFAAGDCSKSIRTGKASDNIDIIRGSQIDMSLTTWWNYNIFNNKYLNIVFVNNSVQAVLSGFAKIVL